MAVETAADRAALFSEEDFAEPGGYTPPGGGTAVPCSVIFDRGRANQGFSVLQRGRSADVHGGAAQGARGEERQAWILAEEVPSVEKKGRLEVGDELLEVAGTPKKEESGWLWLVDLVLVN